MKKTKKTTKDSLMTIFLGEYCEFMTSQKGYTVIQDPESGEEQLLETIININAFLLDMDDKYFYFSYDGHSVNGVINRENVVKLEVIDEPSLNNNEELLNQMHRPSSEEEYN